MKKFVFNNIGLLLLAFLGVTVTSCLKDKGYEDGLYGSIKNTDGEEWISIPKATKQANVVAIEAKDEVQSIDLFAVSYDFVNPATSDITVTVKLKNSMVTDYDPDALPLPTSAYSLPSLQVKVPAGKRLSDALKINLNTSTLDATKVYGIGFTIESVNPATIKIPSNLSNVLFMFNVKNKYDGEYEVTGTMVDHGSASLTGYFPMKYHLITTGVSTVDGFDPVVWEDYFIPIRSGNALSGYGSFSPAFKFDANNNIVEVINVYGQPAGNGRYAELDPSGENKWDPATKTIKVKFFMFQPSVVASGPRVEFDWTMVFKKARP
jgi:hypothetical protein